MSFFDIINVQVLAVGLAGGFVHALKPSIVKKATPWEVVGYIVTGGFAANFFLQFVPLLLKIQNEIFVSDGTNSVNLAIAFAIGMSGRRICDEVERLMAKLWKAKNE